MKEENIQKELECGSSPVILPKRIDGSGIPDEDLEFRFSEDMDYIEKEACIDAARIAYTRRIYEKMGIQVLEEYDGLSWKVLLPAGWKIEPEDHVLWKRVLDGKGRKRARIFYDPTWYGRASFINICRRYRASVERACRECAPYEDYKRSGFIGRIYDENRVIYETDVIPAGEDTLKNFIIEENLKKKLSSYLDKQYPDHRNVLAYWDDSPADGWIAAD